MVGYRGLIDRNTVKVSSDPSVGPHWVASYHRWGGFYHNGSNTDREVWAKMKDPNVKSFIAYRITKDGGRNFDAWIYATEKSAIKQIVRLKEPWLTVYKFKYTRKGITNWKESLWMNSKGFFSKGFVVKYSNDKGHVTWLNNGKELYHVNKDGTIGRRLD